MSPSVRGRTMWIKVCGICHVRDAVRAVELGYDAIGLNFVPSSARRIDPDLGRRIVDAVGSEIEVVGVVADLPLEAMLGLTETVGLDVLQLHGSEPPEVLVELGKLAYKAVRVATSEDVRTTEAYGGDRLLVDAKVDGLLGGSGHAFDWRLVDQIAKTRRMILAGGLHPGNVGEAVRQVAPWGVDVASGVEGAQGPRHKDPGTMRDFIEAARQAAEGSEGSEP